MKYAFKYYVYDRNEYGESIEFLVDSGLPEEIAEKITELRPFYEVPLYCEYDDETNEVSLKAVDL